MLKEKCDAGVKDGDAVNGIKVQMHTWLKYEVEVVKGKSKKETNET